MTQKIRLTQQPVHQGSLGKRMLIGAGIGLIVISAFLIQVRHADPAWGKLWMIRPLFVVPVAGAAGAVFYHLMDRFRYHGGWKKIAANILSLLVCLIGLWLGIVLGLAGTLWH